MNLLDVLTVTATSRPPRAQEVFRTVDIRGAIGKTRSETWQGREYLVAPVTALVEGVIWPVNSTQPELVLAKDLAVAPQGWNGRPIFVGHPRMDGEFASGNTPELLEHESWGMVFNVISPQATFAEKRIRFEAWFDVAKAAIVTGAAELLQDVRDYDSGVSSDPVEVSVGVFALTEEAQGLFNGKKYFGIWHNIVPDHLAIIQRGGKGACSVDMGCGVRVAAMHTLTDHGLELSEEDSAVRTLVERLRDIIPFVRAGTTLEVAEEGHSDSDVRRLLEEALRAGKPNFVDVEAVFPEGDEDKQGAYVVYSCSHPSTSTPYNSGWVLYRRGYSIAEGLVSLTNDEEVVRARRTYELVTAAAGSETLPAATTTTSQPRAACGCATQGEENMDKAQRIQALVAKRPTLKAEDLQTASDAVLTALEEAPQAAAAAATTTTVVTPPAEPVAEQRAAAAAPAVVTLESLLEKADPDTRSAFQGIKAAAASKKAAAITALKASGRCKFTDEQLASKGQMELDTLMELAGVNSVGAPPIVDFSGIGTQRVATADTGVPKPPSMVDSIRASRGQPATTATVQ